MPQARRNERCRCGSGKKYKRCCLAKDSPNVSNDLPWKQVRAARDSLNAQLLEFSTRFYDRDALHAAWEEWCCEFDEDLVPHGGEFVSFMSWFLVDWLDDDEENKNPFPPLSWRFEAEYEDELSRVESEYLASVMDEPFSFFEILEPNPGDGYLLKDILTGREIYVRERSGSEGVKAGGILFGRLATAMHVTIFDSISDTIYPPEWKNSILELRKALRKALKVPKDQMPSLEDIHIYEGAIRRLYRSFRDQALHPKPPTLVNTDGEPLIFNKAIFDIESAEVVFEALHPLCFAETKEVLLEWATKDKDGSLLKVEFSWLKKTNARLSGVNNTVLGHITIEKNRMTVETNSQERVKKIKAIIKKSCGNAARFKTTLIEPLEAKMKEARARADSPPKPSQAQQDLTERPEIKAKLQEIVRANMESWILKNIPALGNKTPPQAIRTPEGREMVESLLNQFERGAGAMGDRDFELGLIQGIRKKLGLSK